MTRRRKIESVEKDEGPEVEPVGEEESVEEFDGEERGDEVAGIFVRAGADDGDVKDSGLRGRGGGGGSEPEDDVLTLSFVDTETCYERWIVEDGKSGMVEDGLDDGRRKNELTCSEDVEVSKVEDGG